MNPSWFLANRIRECALLVALGAELRIAVVKICQRGLWHLRGAARWLSVSVVVFATVNVWVWLATGAILFWATPYFSGPNLMQSAHHFARLLLEQSNAPVKALVLGSS